MILPPVEMIGKVARVAQQEENVGEKVHKEELSYFHPFDLQKSLNHWMDQYPPGSGVLHI